MTIMKKLTLTNGKIVLVDDEDFDELSQFNWSFQKDAGGYSGYAIRCKGRCGIGNKPKTVYMHREILKAPIGVCVDHKNGNKLDNRKENLRLATKSQNGANMKNITHSSKFKGVHHLKRTGKWTAGVMKNYKRVHCGYFSTEIEAAEAYKEKSLELFGDYANSNLI